MADAFGAPVPIPSVFLFPSQAVGFLSASMCVALPEGFLWPHEYAWDVTARWKCGGVNTPLGSIGGQ